MVIMTTTNPSFPPVSDAIQAVKQIDWKELRRRSLRDINQIGVVLAVAGEKLHDAGVYLADLK